MESLTFEQAVKFYEKIHRACSPATLDPLYLAADASRSIGLEPLHLAFESQGQRWLHSLHRSKVAGTNFWDVSSPYGYGGPSSTCNTPQFLQAAWTAYTQWMRDERVVVEYLRFHPLVENDSFYPGIVTPNRAVVWIDLKPNDWMAGYAKRLRYSLKKAVRIPLHYSEMPLATAIAEFADFYRAAMTDMGAEDFYSFENLYFEKLARMPGARLAVCRKAPAIGAPWLAACIVLHGKGISEYHLAAASIAGRSFGASSYLLHCCVESARQIGQHSFYLGGGTNGLTDNSLLFFKAAYSSARVVYKTGSQIFDIAAYAQLQEAFPAAWSAHPERAIFYRKA